MADVKLHYIEDSAWLQYHEVRTGAGGTVELIPVSCANWESSRGSAVPLDLRPDSAAAGVLSLQEDSVSCDSTDCQKARWPKHKLHCGDVPYEPEFQLPTFTPPRPLYTTPPPPALHRQLDFLERYPSFNYFLLLRNKVFGIRIPPMGIPPVEGRRAEAMTCSSMSAKTEAAGKLCMMLLGQIILSRV